MPLVDADAVWGDIGTDLAALASRHRDIGLHWLNLDTMGFTGCAGIQTPSGGFVVHGSRHPAHG